MIENFIGLSTSGHDPALAVVNTQGKVVFAEATERFVQQKRAWGIDADHSDHIRSVLPGVLNDNEHSIISRSWAKSKNDVPVNFSGSLLIDNASVKWLSSLQNKTFSNAGINLNHYLPGRTNLIPESFDHHLCHAVNACYSTKFESGICLVIDGDGEVGAASLYRLRDRKLSRIWRSWGPGSLGSFYGWLTEICGFSWQKGEEWKVMGLAAYGSPVGWIVEQLKQIIDVKNGKPFLLDHTKLKAIIEKLEPFYRKPGEEILMAADLAASGQSAYSYFVDQMLAHCETYGESNLILSGGCALNSSYNGSIVGRFNFTNIHVPPAPADDGNAIGAALLSWMRHHKTEQIPYSGGAPYLGKTVKSDAQSLMALSKYGRFASVTDLGGDCARVIAKKLFEGKVIGVIKGAAEFGPRALGNRSILADPRGAGTKDYINNEIKARESYRPFAPVVFEHEVSKYFRKTHISPYMSFTLPWKPDMYSIVPAVVHADGTGRLQTVNQQNNLWLCNLLSEFGKLSGVPILLNTSFNVMGKPIVDTLHDALVVLVTSGLDAVLFDTILIEK